MRKKLRTEIDLIGNTLADLRKYDLEDADAQKIADDLLQYLYRYEQSFEPVKKKAKEKVVPISKEIVTIMCYGEIEHRERNDAIKFYKEAASYCDGSEKERYSNVLLGLYDGKGLCWDGVEAAEGYHLCKYCGDLVLGKDKNVLCDYCRETFGHSKFSEL